MTKIGLVQMNSGPDPEANLVQLKKKLKGLQLQGARLVVTPENTLVFGANSDYKRHAEVLGDGPLQTELAAFAKQLGIWLLIGSMPISQPDGKITSTALLFDDQGVCIAHYNKLHMFDVEIEDKHHSYRESDTFQSGNEIKVVETPFGKIGLSICYDVRFPQMYSALREQGADIIVVPAAFTKVTGKAHWDILLRARAIETQCWLIAAAQWGEHNQGRETWGHSMIIDPWGQVLACQQQGTGVLTADIDLDFSQTIRTNMPLVEHARFSVHPR
ncbi:MULTISPECIES: carbon-nitrogen hydrolase family protein [Photobacterium]|uniref:Carbon-nitrogen hydrolase n=2 Tax=Photobacterium TaxID=657 RepID=Q6LMA7_PHOPR|nr:MULTISPECIES: carbon-nitrogen hydrolase family protein [Photobacterium]PSU47022.1 carbon-nitrogen hydrolase family protein [Photobacterium frigidiphilum]CAG21570.1 putative carbon-nitrogen hydrolase [Photobacterium profundum SS9]